MPNGELTSEQDAQRAAAAAQKEGIRPNGEIRGIYPIAGEDLLVEIRKATPEELPGVLGEFWAVREGLKFGADLWNLGDPEQLVILSNLFTTVESGTQREALVYPETEVNNKVGARVREIKREAKKEGRKLKETEEKEVSQLVALENQNQARELVDAAYLQRMATCENAQLVADLLLRDPNWRPSIKPDKGHWVAFFSGDFGQKVNDAMEGIVIVAMDEEGRKEALNARLVRKREKLDELVVNLKMETDEADKAFEEYEKRTRERFEQLPQFKHVEQNIYVEGLNKSTEDFKAWLEYLLKITDGDMAAVWAGWRVALTWELPGQFGMMVNKKGETKIGDPPVVSDATPWLVHLEAKRFLEWGLSPDGKKRIRSTRYPSHTGYPLSLDKFGELCPSYLHNSKVDFKRGEGKVSLFEVWWEKGIGLNEGEFPWALTELQPAIDTDELPPGGFAAWLLKRMRGLAVADNIRSRPSLAEMAQPEFWSGGTNTKFNVRNWDKVFGTYEEFKEAEGREMHPGENPLAWWLLGALNAHRLNPGRRTRIIKELGDKFDYRTFWQPERFSIVPKGTETDQQTTPSVYTILNHAWQSESLRKEDLIWICEKLGGIKASPLAHSGVF